VGVKIPDAYFSVEDGLMKDGSGSTHLGLGGVALVATAIGAVAVGAFAIGALTIRRLAISLEHTMSRASRMT